MKQHDPSSITHAQVKQSETTGGDDSIVFLKERSLSSAPFYLGGAEPSETFCPVTVPLHQAAGVFGRCLSIMQITLPLNSSSSTFPHLFGCFFCFNPIAC